MAISGAVWVAVGAGPEDLAALRARGVLGAAFNAAMYGVSHYAAVVPLLRRLGELDMWAQFQVAGDQLLELLPIIDQVPRLKLLFDHCGRPVASRGLTQPGFQALLGLGREGRAVVKLSGEAKFAEMPFPFDDTRPYVEALVEAFGLTRCIWASDWPYVKAPCRLDFGPMLRRWDGMFTAAERHQLMHRSASALFGFA